MIVDLRIYTVRPGKLAAFVALYRDHAWPLQQKHLGECLGWYTTVEGTLNQVVHLWRYESQADRETRRNTMAADPAWGDYLRRSEEAAIWSRRRTGCFARPILHGRRSRVRWPNGE